MIIRCSIVNRSLLQSGRAFFACVSPSHHKHFTFVKHHSAITYRSKRSHHNCCVPDVFPNVNNCGSIALYVHPACTSSLSSSPAVMRSAFNQYRLQTKVFADPQTASRSPGGSPWAARRHHGKCIQASLEAYVSCSTVYSRSLNHGS